MLWTSDVVKDPWFPWTSDVVKDPWFPLVKDPSGSMSSYHLSRFTPRRDVRARVAKPVTPERMRP